MSGTDATLHLVQSVVVRQENPALRAALAFSAFDEPALARRLQSVRMDPRIWRGSRADRLSIAMAAALLRPLRLLAASGSGPGCVAELPFLHVDSAAATCAELEEAPVPDLACWLERHLLTRWVIDSAAWRRRMDAARQATAGASVHEVFENCDGRSVAAARACRLEVGPLDGAEAIELIFDDASVVIGAVSQAPLPGRLIGTRLIRCDDAATKPIWTFQDPHGGRSEITLLDRRGLRVQPSPMTR
jgi:hypothetical protein